jgi:hypothetical protein
MSEKLDAEGFYASSLCKVDPDGKPCTLPGKSAFAPWRLLTHFVTVD